MKDPEFIQMRNKFLFAVLIAIVFAIPLLIFVFRVYGNTSIVTRLDREETFTILVTTKKCDNCKMVEKIFEEYNVDYLNLNNVTNKDYQAIMKRMEIENKRNTFPIIIYVEDGKMKANLFDVNSREQVTDFLDFHGLVNSK